MRWDVAREFDRAHGLPRSSVFETLYRTEAWHGIERGIGDLAEWAEGAHRELERRAGRPLPRLHDEWRRAQTAIAANLELVRRLRPRYKLSVLSNADVSLRGRLERDGIHALFDDVVVSAEVGMAKPDPAIFRLAAERLGLAPARVRLRGRLGRQRRGGARGRHARGAPPRRQGRRPAHPAPRARHRARSD